jgi:hypothetical protein
MPGSSFPVPAQNGAVAQTPTPTSVLQGREPSHEPDVVLDVSELHVGEIELDVENLKADVALQTRVANLVQLQAGAHVEIAKVYLDIKDVDVKAMLKVRLDNVYSILDRALTTLDRQPEILQGIIETADDALKPGGAVSNTLEGVSGSLGNLTSGLGEGVGESLRNLSSGLGEGIGALGNRAHRLGNVGARVHLLTRVAAAAGVVGGLALAAHSNGGIDKTLKELTS